ncbi:hypothetical protein [Streptomyces sp. UH6]|uniref:hypothetical protein n=1 Tax=Streptomyces sp. UH6 TaxID=2748379 RepID=UPI0015D4E447|nr:hypothetical protein [Streptomyces sp. UH6]NYV73585.1 hypothetical protein [Streptomyces sp. UH6]
MIRLPLPPGTQECFDARHCFAALASWSGGDWPRAVAEVVRRHPVLQSVEPALLRKHTQEVLSPAGAFELATLISAGSLLVAHADAVSLRTPDPKREQCLRRLLECLGEGPTYFTNHGGAEEGRDADFLTTAFHADVIAGPTLDICLIGVTNQRLLVLWRFEED